jgi:hypothetical protein
MLGFLGCAAGRVGSQGNPSGRSLGGASVDPSARATADMQALMAGNQASKGDNDVWGTITLGPR